MGSEMCIRDSSYGARPLRRAVMRLLEDSLAEEVLSEKIQNGDSAVVDIDEEGQVKVLLGKPLEKEDLVTAVK